MKKDNTIKSLLSEGTNDIFKFITEPETQFTDKHKAAFLENVKNFNKLSPSIYREMSLKDVTQTLQTMVKVADRIIMTETDDWFDQVSLKRDVKSLNDSMILFEKTAKEIHQMQNRLESTYEDIGLKLNKYFEIHNAEEESTVNEKNESYSTVEDIKKLDGQEVPDGHWDMIRKNKNIKRVSMLGKSNKNDKVETRIIFDDKSDIIVYV